jgi:hypothetical protein
LNRYKKVLVGDKIGDKEVQQHTNCKVIWKIPNAFDAVADSIDRGSPIVLQERSEISRSYRGLAAALAGDSGPNLWWNFPAPTSDEGPEGADAAGIAVKKPRRPNLNSGSAAATLDERLG